MTNNDTLFDNFLQETLDRDRSLAGALTLSFSDTCGKIEQKRKADMQRQKITIRLMMSVILAIIVTNILIITMDSPDTLAGIDDNGYISESTNYFTEILQ